MHATNYNLVYELFTNVPTSQIRSIMATSLLCLNLTKLTLQQTTLQHMMMSGYQSWWQILCAAFCFQYLLFSDERTPVMMSTHTDPSTTVKPATRGHLTKYPYITGFTVYHSTYIIHLLYGLLQSITAL